MGQNLIKKIKKSEFLKNKCYQSNTILIKNIKSNSNHSHIWIYDKVNQSQVEIRVINTSIANLFLKNIPFAIVKFPK